MGDPFFTGINRVDLLCGGALAAAAEYSRLDMAIAAWDSIEPSTGQIFSGGGFVPDVYVLVSARYVVIACQGTLSVTHWAGNVLGSIQGGIVGLPGMVNTYFGTAAVSMTAAIRSHVTPLLMAGRKLVSVGHSLGGALAACIAYRLRAETGAQMQVITYGSPRIGDPAFSAGFLPGQVVRVEAIGDPIPCLPPALWAAAGSVFPVPGPGTPALYAQLGAPYTLDEEGDVVAGSFLVSITGVAAWLSHGDPITPHTIGEYARRLRAGIPGLAMLPGAFGYADPGAIDASLLGTLTGSFPQYVVPAPMILHDPSDPNFTGGGDMGMWRCTFFFKTVDYGWSESYYKDETDHDLVATAATDLAKKRLVCCGIGVQMPAVRISDTATYRDFGLTALNLSTGTEGEDPGGHAKPFSALLINLISGQYRNRIFMRGCASADILGDRPLNITTTLRAAIKAFSTFMRINQWRMRVQARFAPDVVGGAVTAASTATPIVITTGAPHTLVSNDKVFIRGVAGNTAANGTHYIDVLSPTTFALRDTVPTSPYLGAGVWRKVAYSYPIIQNSDIIREVSRRTGRPFDLPVGRRRRRTAS